MAEDTANNVPQHNWRDLLKTHMTVSYLEEDGMKRGGWTDWAKKGTAILVWVGLVVLAHAVFHPFLGLIHQHKSNQNCANDATGALLS